MTQFDNLNSGQVRDILKRLAKLESGTPMNNAAVGRSGFEVYDGGTINISSGNILGAGGFSWQGSFSQSGSTTFSGSTTIAGPTGVTGSLTIQGTTSVTGPFTVTGATKLNGVTDVGGAFTVTGLTKLQGNTTVSGTLDVTGNMASKGTLSIEGITTLKNDLILTGGGKITAGNVTIDPTSSGGAVLFSTGGGIQGAGGDFVAKGAGNAGFLSNDTAALFAGSKQITVSDSGYKFASVPTTTSAANVYMDASGNLFRKP